MKRTFHWAIISLPAFIFAVAGFTYLCDGISVNASFPIPLHLRIGEAESPTAYRAAAKSLLGANQRNGDAQIARAEAEFHAVGNIQSATSLVLQGLTKSPASVEGWIFYAEMLAPSDPEKAARALHVSYMVSSQDFFAMPRRCELAASVWPYLEKEDQTAAYQETRKLWIIPGSRYALMALTGTAAGRELVTRAWMNSPEQIRLINRWVSAQNRQLLGQPK